jgi:phosphatidate cytidylyltransferase
MLLALGTQYEYISIVRKSTISISYTVSLVSGASLFLVTTAVASGLAGGELLIVLLLIPSALIISELFMGREKPFESVAHIIFSLIYTILPFSLFVFGAFEHDGLKTILPYQGEDFTPGLVIGFFILIWANDSGAYIFGSLFGRHRLLERISPKKSWEGFFGGMALSAVVAWLAGRYMGVISVENWIIASLVVSVAGTLGDLVESLLKRSAGIKDSGTIMPGHGGFLDRFDSTLIAFPALFLYVTFFG